jgi:hypothetical protein
MHRLVAIVLKIGGFKPAHSARMPPGDHNRIAPSKSRPEGRAAEVRC